MDSGIIRNELADERHDKMWASIHLEGTEKNSLLCWGALGLAVGNELDRAETALNRIAMLTGRPGTGKSTLARGLGGPLRSLVGGTVRVIEINGHAVMSGDHGQSQREAARLITEVVPDLAGAGATVVVVDEVESIAVAREAVSFDANPVDVHRTTDAVIAAVDVLADRCPNVLVVVTTNFPDAVDSALRSRADTIIDLPLPGPDAIHEILTQTLGAWARKYPNIKRVADDKRLPEVARLLHGIDARQVRKAVADTLASDIRTASDPNTLTVEDLLDRARNRAR
jgi:AAA+ superfamily predicted ATPase